MFARLVWEVPNCPGNICPYLEYLSCYFPDFNETLKVTSWEQLEQIPTIKLTFVQARIDLVTFVHIWNISAVTNSIVTKKFSYFLFLEPDYFIKNYCTEIRVWISVFRRKELCENPILGCRDIK